MSPEETGNLLGICAAYDNREVDEVTVIAWYRALGDLGYAECEAAVVAHYTNSRDWIMPADVRGHVKRSRRAADDRGRIRQLLDPRTYQREVRADDARTLALIQQRAGRTLAIEAPPAIPRDCEPPPPRRVIHDPQEAALAQAAASRAARGAPKTTEPE